ncbi:MAG TPA: hypothetical protein VGJ90_09520 [Methylophilaceae bacterium]|jgi:hypothetical protein
MKTVNLNYAPVRYRHVTWYACFGASALCLFALLFFYQQLVAEASAIDANITQIKSPQHNDNARLSAHKVNADEMMSVQLAMRELTIPWEALFETLETLNGSGVRLLSVEPEVKQHQLKITAEASDIKQILDYVSALAPQANLPRAGKNQTQTDPLENVLLISQAPATGTSGQPLLNFVVEAKWAF